MQYELNVLLNSDRSHEETILKPNAITLDVFLPLVLIKFINFGIAGGGIQLYSFCEGNDWIIDQLLLLRNCQGFEDSVWNID